MIGKKNGHDATDWEKPHGWGNTRRIRQQLKATEEIIRALKQDLGFYRERHDVLLEERSKLLETISRLDALKGERTEAGNETELLKSERDRLGAELRSLSEENQQLRNRCSLLEVALADHRKRLVEAKEVIVCLEEQIAQLESIVDLMREHQQLKRTEERLQEYQRRTTGDFESDPIKE